MLQMVKASLRKLETLSVQERLHLQIVLAILHLANPNPKQINKLANKLNIPLLGFQTFDELASYLEAVIRSGISKEEKSGTVFFMGNTEQHWVLRFEKHLIPRQGSKNFEHFLLTNIKTCSHNPFPHSGILRDKPRK